VPSLLSSRTSIWDGGALVIRLAAAAIAVWILIELGPLPGEPGKNRYGAPPASKTRAS